LIYDTRPGWWHNLNWRVREKFANFCHTDFKIDPKLIPALKLSYNVTPNSDNINLNTIYVKGVTECVLQFEAKMICQKQFGQRKTALKQLVTSTSFAFLNKAIWRGCCRQSTTIGSIEWYDYSFIHWMESNKFTLLSKNLYFYGNYEIGMHVCVAHTSKVGAKGMKNVRVGFNWSCERDFQNNVISIWPFEPDLLIEKPASDRIYNNVCSQNGPSYQEIN
jgi:hypothetical protein